MSLTGGGILKKLHIAPVFFIAARDFAFFVVDQMHWPVRLRKGAAEPGKPQKLEDLLGYSREMVAETWHVSHMLCVCRMHQYDCMCAVCALNMMFSFGFSFLCTVAC